MFDNQYASKLANGSYVSGSDQSNINSNHVQSPKYTHQDGYCPICNMARHLFCHYSKVCENNCCFFDFSISCVMYSCFLDSELLHFFCCKARETQTLRCNDNYYYSSYLYTISESMYEFHGIIANSEV